MILLVIIGFVSGIISGMGIGGGTILIPALTVFLNYNQHTAQNINLIYFIPTAIIAIITHTKKGNIEKKVLWKIILFGVIGAVIGSIIAVNINPTLLRKLFAVFLIVMGINEIFFNKKQTQH